MVWIILILLCMISILCIFSSTSRLLSGEQTRFDLVKEQALMVIICLAGIVLVYKFAGEKLLKFISSIGFLGSLVLLLMLNLGVNWGNVIKAGTINEARRTLIVGGLQLHVFEVVKVAMVLYLAWAVDAFKHHKLKGDFLPEKWKKVLYIYLPFIVIFVMVIPGSNSSALLIGSIMFMVVLLGGGNFKDMAILLGSGLVLIALCVGVYKISNETYMGRIGTAATRLFDDTDWEKRFHETPAGSKEKQEALDKLRQPYSAMIAVHEGGLLFGKGPGQSTQRYVVPDISEDYVYSFLIEEYGLVLGGIGVIILYVSLLARGAIIVRNCGRDLYAKLCVAGLCLLITGQAFVHMFVNLGIGPMTGQTLPLISHGKTAFICFSFAFGVILSLSRIASKRIARETREAGPLVDFGDVARDRYHDSYDRKRDDEWYEEEDEHYEEEDNEDYEAEDGR